MFDLTATRTALTNVIALWPLLADAVGARPAGDWPPAMGISRLREPDEAGDGRPGDVRPLPISVDVFDAMTEITERLVDLADRIAADTQRPAMSHAPRTAGWPAADRERRDQLADADAADPRRWRYTGQRSAPAAAQWLAHRLSAKPGGPFAPLALQHLHQIQRAAETAADRIETLLRIARRTTATGRTHDGCGGDLMVSGGDGTDPAIDCDACGRRWTLDTTAAA
ncbi:hypothetical protein FH609_004215 [Streptomyces sp. 3MP-14]|uniref:Uncharacterized protein n=1 Tax=Streptomyces mimosae TaxID=2586635 RepID=A0A5N6A2D4_9ACTN|nr:MULTISPECIES: hypothetical protein [Streptomyces]KAB8162937.1 hypothetical protein FH607_020075 [Streptomyces mimosae]KAB8179151.1 hypothetical protein FH609_004215 [Streptomyces sp. 3MP-14]